MKARIVYVDPEVNSGKLSKLNDLYAAYQSYVQSCVQLMIKDHRPSVIPSERRTYFPTSEILSSQILKNAQLHAVQLIETWIKGLYGRKLKKQIRLHENLTDHQRMELCCCGKYLVKRAGKFGKGTISQEMVDLYWSWVWDIGLSGQPPQVSENLPMMLSEMTCSFGPAEGTTHFGWWIKTSCLVNGRTVKIPLAYNPYLKSVEGLAKSVLAKKREGRWVFQFCEKTEEPEFERSSEKLGVDVGLNMIAATSEGELFGADFKPKFDKLYGRVRTLRANRQRQELKKDSKRLARLERKLSGMTKTATGTVANKLVEAYPATTFVIEDLDLKGSRGQKRFAYRALHHSLSTKAPVEVVNPAYTSQMCPSCGHISRLNRSGTKFHCRSCGRKSHADVVGGIDLLRRSEDKQVNSIENLSEVKILLRKRYLRKRNSSSGELEVNELKPISRKLTTEIFSSEKIGTASNLVRDQI